MCGLELGEDGCVRARTPPQTSCKPAGSRHESNNHKEYDIALVDASAALMLPALCGNTAAPAVSSSYVLFSVFNPFLSYSFFSLHLTHFPYSSFLILFFYPILFSSLIRLFILGVFLLFTQCKDFRHPSPLTSYMLAWWSVLHMESSCLQGDIPVSFSCSCVSFPAPVFKGLGFTYPFPGWSHAGQFVRQPVCCTYLGHHAGLWHLARSNLTLSTLRLAVVGDLHCLMINYFQVQFLVRVILGILPFTHLEHDISFW